MNYFTLILCLGYRCLCIYNGVFAYIEARGQSWVVFVPQYLFTKVCVCLCVFRQVHVFAHKCGNQRGVLSVFSFCSLSNYLEVGYLTEPEFVSLPYFQTLGHNYLISYLNVFVPIRNLNLGT